MRLPYCSPLCPNSAMERDAALVELHRRMGEFKTIAKIAMANDAQLLETVALAARLGPACTIHTGYA